MKNIAVLLPFIFIVSCIRDKSTDDEISYGKYVGEIDCGTNYRVFSADGDPLYIKREGLLPSDTISIKGIKYNYVFFAQISDELFKNSRYKEFTPLEFYSMIGYFPLKRNTISCGKYKNYMEKLKIKSIN